MVAITRARVRAALRSIARTASLLLVLCALREALVSSSAPAVEVELRPAPSPPAAPPPPTVSPYRVALEQALEERGRLLAELADGFRRRAQLASGATAATSGAASVAEAPPSPTAADASADVAALTDLAARTRALSARLEDHARAANLGDFDDAGAGLPPFAPLKPLTAASAPPALFEATGDVAAARALVAEPPAIFHPRPAPDDTLSLAGATPARHAARTALPPVVFAVTTVPPGSAVGTGVEVVLASPAAQTIQPGGTVTASFRVTNKTGKALQFSETLELPAGFRAVSPTPALFQLEAGELDIRLITFAVPKTVGAGKQRVSYIVTAPQDGTVRAVVPLEIAVPRLQAVRSETEQKPETSIAGLPFEARVRFTNTGNEPEAIDIQVVSSPELPVTWEPKQLVLKPGAGAQVFARVRTDRARSRTSHSLTFRAVRAGTKDVVSEETVLTDLVPRIAGEPMVHYPIPSVARLMIPQEGGRGSLITELSGGGPLGPNSKDRIDYLVRYPNGQLTNSLAQIDEYRFDYYRPDFDYGIGDRTFSLSTLTENFRYGRGVQLDRKISKLAMGGWYVRSRFEDPSSEEGALHLDYDAWPRVTMRANHLWKRDNDIEHAHLVDSIEGLARLPGDGRIDVEVAQSHGDRDTIPVDDNAYHVLSTGPLSADADYTLEKLYAGPEFKGRVQDADLTVASASFPVTNQIRGNATVRTFKNNLAFDPAVAVAANELLYQAAASTALSTSASLTAQFRAFQRQDELPPADFDFRETTGLATLSLAHRKIAATLSAERGDLEDALEARSFPIERYLTQVNYQASPEDSYAIGYSIGPSPLSGSRLRNTSLTGSVNAKLSSKVTAQVNYVKNRTDSPDNSPRRQTEQVLTQLRYALAEQQSLDLRARHLIPDDGDTTSSYLFSYTAPFTTPGRRLKDIAILSGRIFEADSPDKRGVGNVQILAGSAITVSNPDGRFFFPPLKAGALDVRVDKVSLGRGRTTAVPYPIQIDVTTARPATLQIPVVRAGNLTGTVTLFAPTGPPDEADPKAREYQESGPATNVLVEATDGKEIQRRLTNPSGAFLFDDLRPGTWKVKVFTETLPPDHTVESGEGSYDVVGGATRTVAIKVVPRFRPIKILEEGEQILRIQF